MNKKIKIIFISWAPYCSRSDNIARELKGKSYMIYYDFFGSNYITILIKYLLQTIKTLLVLFRERPTIILCMSPPIFSPLPVWLYTKIFPGTAYAIDYHTASFVIPIFRKLFFIQKFFSRQAITNIVTNLELSKIIINWKVDVTIIADVRVIFNNISKFSGLKKGFNISFISRFSSTEPIGILLKAAEKLKNFNVNFYITGSLKEANQDLFINHPANVYFTDFLSDSEYAGLLRDSDAVMSLVTNDNTMQRGAYEAMALETPIIISNWKILRETFYKGAVYVDNTIDGIVCGIKEMINNKEKFKKEIVILKKERSQIWEFKMNELLNKFNSNNHGVLG